jgi:hypothetical protein
MQRRLVAAALLVLLVSCWVSADVGEESVALTNGRTAALGGIHAALADSEQVLFANPAGLIEVEPGFSVSELTFRLSGPVFSIAGLVVQGIGGAEFTTLLASESVQDLLKSIYAGFSLTGPLYFGFVGDGIGFGLHNSSAAVVQSVGSTSIQAVLTERFLLNGGYAFAIPLPESWNSTVSAGVVLKGFLRGDVTVATSLLSLPSLVENVSPELLTGSPFSLTSGIGADVGVRYGLGEWLAVGVTGMNAITFTGTLNYATLNGFIGSTEDPGAPVYDILPQSINLGFLFSPPLGGLQRYINDLTILLDYRDIFDFWITPADTENILLKLGAGLEARLLEVLSLRAGFNQGLFAAGLGIDLNVLNFNAAMYGTELTSEPGLRPVYNLLLGLEFRL